MIRARCIYVNEKHFLSDSSLISEILVVDDGECTLSVLGAPNWVLEPIPSHDNVMAEQLSFPWRLGRTGGVGESVQKVGR